ncbi:glycosyltransferase family protein [Flavicella sediminum]|uniref:glycosyltransferase family protein n=1 Tax=Flavicella sediminum TaxID=2585141 RepID=UPI00112456D1|nr:glycosyltransferase family protein [Flavicella sediminum]
MKILYAIQGTGNGHLSRAKDVIPALRNRVEVDVLISGTQADVELPFDVKYVYNGLSFYFGSKGGINFFNTLKKNSIRKFMKEVRECPVQDYDLVINDFEPISAWACKLRGVNCISLSHQSALLSKKVPQPTYRDFISPLILKYYAPALQSFGFHFKKYDSSIYLPIIRQDIRQLRTSVGNHNTVYLPSYSDKKIAGILTQIKQVNWQVFSKTCKKAYRKKNVYFNPITSEKFEESLATCAGVICGAGFETPAEALFLKKKLLVIPMVGQYEQQYNAVSLKEMGVKVLPKLKKKHLKKIRKWVNDDKVVKVNFPDRTQFIVDAVLSKYIIANELTSELLQEI